jgi:hypothetical protein
MFLFCSNLLAEEGIAAMNAIAHEPMSSSRTNVLNPAHAEPFRDAESAWFWTMAALAARRDGSRSSAPRIPRCCDPDDVLRSLDQLYRRRRIDLLHARIMRVWGERGIAPNPAHARERCDARIWREAMDRLEWPLRMKGIVG